jgi:thiol-disulfide isomerase/thioredoxin
VKRYLTFGRFWDAIALIAIAFVVWKVFLAPRGFERAGAHPAPHAVYQRLDGGTLRIADERGHLLFLDFFASWCEPCKAELPLVESWAARHPGDRVALVDVGEPRSVAVAFAQRYHLRDVALDPSSNAQAFFSVRGFPTIVVVDPNGYVRATWEGLNPAIGLAMTNALRLDRPR